MNQRLLFIVVTVLVGACSSTTSSSGTPPNSTGADAAVEVEDGGNDGGEQKDSTAPKPDAGTQSCASRKGSYSYAETLVSGNCGDALTNVFDPATCTQGFCFPYINLFEAGGPTTFPPGSQCEGTIKTAADNCSVDFAYSCPISAGSLQVVGKATWNAAGKAATATKSVNAFNPSMQNLCSGTYTVTVTAL